MIERSSLSGGLGAASATATAANVNPHLPRHLAHHHKSPEEGPRPAELGGDAKKRVIRPKPLAKPSHVIHRQVLYEINPAVHGLFGNVKDMYQVRGPRAFVQGFMPTIARQVMNSTVRFTTFNFLKQYFHPNDSEPVPGLLAFGIGAVSGGVEVLATQPIDVVKTRMQTVNGIKVYGSSLLCSYKIFVHEGPTKLWAGMLPRFIKVTFSGGIIFGVYEFSNRLVMKAMQENPFSWE